MEHIHGHLKFMNVFYTYISISIYRTSLIVYVNYWNQCFAEKINYIATNNAEIKIPPIQKPVKCTLYQY